MIRVFSSPLVAHVHIVRRLLEVEGVPCLVLGEARTSLGGALPMDDCLVELLVPRVHAERALEVVEEVLAPNRHGALSLVADEAGHLSPVGWTCEGCGESSPPSFEICWSCQTPRSPS